MTESAATYSGIPSEGWNDRGSYDRLQFSNVANPVESLQETIAVIMTGLENFEGSQQSRLDMRISTRGIQISDFEQLRLVFSGLEMSALSNPLDSNDIWEITVCLNNFARALGEARVQQLEIWARQRQQEVIAEIGNFAESTITPLEQIQQKGFVFETETFSGSELYQLWSTTFGWQREQCDAYSKEHGNSDNEFIYGLRNEAGELVAAVLISHGESTEWAVLPSYRKHHLITPLLIAGNVDWVSKRSEEVLYAHLRLGWSDKAFVRSGGSLILPEDNPLSLLTNHVTIGPPGTSDPGNEDRAGFLDGTTGECLRTFVVGQVDPKSFSNEVCDRYSKALTPNLITI